MDVRRFEEFSGNVRPAKMPFALLAHKLMRLRRPYIGEKAMNTHQREEIQWREQRRRLVEAWNRSGNRYSDADDDDIDLKPRIRILHHQQSEELTRPAVRR